MVKQTGEVLAQYRADLQKAARRKLPSKYIIRLGETPALYQKYGLPASSLNLPSSIVKKAMEVHHISMTLLERLPDLLQNPRAVFESLKGAGSVVSVVDARDKEHRQIIAILKPSRNGLTMVLSVYGRNNFADFVKNNIKSGKVKAISRKWATDNIGRQELQLLKWDVVGDLDTISLTSPEKSSSPDGDNHPPDTESV
jgi:hypothetical protein